MFFVKKGKRLHFEKLYKKRGGRTLEEERVLQTGKDLNGKMAFEIVRTANQYDSDIFLEKDNKKVNVKSVMGIMTLGIKKGETITLYTKGKDAKQILELLIKMIK